MTDLVQNSPREKSKDVTHLHEMHNKLLRGERDVEKIVAVEMLIVESSEEIEPVDVVQEGVSLTA